MKRVAMASGYTVTWSNGMTGTTITLDENDVPVGTSVTLTVTVTDANGCSATDDVTVNTIDISCNLGRGNSPIMGVQMCDHRGRTRCMPVSSVAAKLGLNNNGNGNGVNWTLGPCGTTVHDDCSNRLAPSKIGNEAAGNDVAKEGMLEAYPNPFSQATTIRFNPAASGQVSLKVFDVTGIQVADLFNEDVTAGEVYEVEFSANDLAKGIYYAKLYDQSGNVQVTKLAVVK